MPLQIVHATSIIADGNMDFRFGSFQEVTQNRMHFLEKNGLSLKQYIPMRSDHKDIITTVSLNDVQKAVTSRDEELEADVLVTQERDLALMLTTADCQAVSFFDPVTKTIALAHISRHTLAQNLAQKTITYLQEHCNTNPADVLVYISPYIHTQSYTFPLPLQEVSPVLAPFIEERDGFAHINMLKATLHQLTHVGVLEEHVTASDVDTALSSKHFSFYRATRDGTKDGRMATILALR